MPRATPQYTGRAKYNFIVCDVGGTPTGGDLVAGSYFRIDTFYPEMFIADTNNVIYDVSGNPLVIEFDTIENIVFDQFFINKDDKTISFTEAPLTEPCYTETLKLMKLNDGLFDIDGKTFV